MQLVSLLHREGCRGISRPRGGEWLVLGRRSTEPQVQAPEHGNSCALVRVSAHEERIR